jgi:DNA-binding CsgD family transcriptional regulator
LLCGSETWTIKASDARRITAAEMKYMRRTAGHTWTDHKTNAQVAKELQITPILDKLLEYKRSWMKYMRRTAGHTWTDYKTNAQVAKELQITPILDKLLEYKRSWTQHVNRMPRNRLPRVMKHYCPTGRRNRGRPLKRLLDT